MIGADKTFAPLPNTFAKEGEGWTSDTTGLPGAKAININAKVVSGDLGTDNNATWHRTYTNARVATAHMRNPNMEIPSWFWETVHDAAGIIQAHRTLAAIPLPESKGLLTPMPIPPADYINASKNNALVVQSQTVIMANQHTINDTQADGYWLDELRNTASAIGNTHTEAIAYHLVQAAHTVANSPKSLVAPTQARQHMAEAWRLYQMLDVFEQAEKLDNQPTQIGENETTDIEQDWSEVIDNLDHWDDGRQDNNCTDWGKMTIEEIELPIRVAQISGRRRKRRLTDAGAALTRPDRIMTDGMCFSQRGNKKDFIGAVLIDNSGSMSMTAQQVEDLIHAAPGVIVAQYSGASDVGTLTIVAKDGRSTYDLQSRHGGNSIDGPALDWLGQQQGPRVWVSDGYVTNKHNQINRSLVAISIQQCINYDITRVRHLDQLVAWAQSIAGKRAS